eukprot:3682215-Alexandrium_andersonii.AAC.1
MHPSRALGTVRRSRRTRPELGRLSTSLTFIPGEDHSAHWACLDRGLLGLGLGPSISLWPEGPAAA